MLRRVGGSSPTVRDYVRIRDGDLVGFTGQTISPFPLPQVLRVYSNDKPHESDFGGVVSEFLYLGENGERKTLLTWTMAVNLSKSNVSAVHFRNGVPQSRTESAAITQDTLRVTFNSTERAGNVTVTYKMKETEPLKISRTYEIIGRDGEVGAVQSDLFRYEGSVHIAKRD